MVYPVRKASFVRLALWLGLCGMCLWLPTAIADDLPALATISTTLPDEERETFTQQKLALEIQLKNLQAAAAAFNARTAENQTDGEFNAVQAQRAAYVKAAEAFNNSLAMAVKANTPCVHVAQLQHEFQSLTHQIELDRQVIQNFGFARTVAEIEYWGRLPARQVEDAKTAFKAMLFDATLDSISEAAGVLGSLTASEVDALNRLADTEGASPLRIVAGANDVHRALEFLDKAKRAYGRE
jgi:hypothetical protein